MSGTASGSGINPGVVQTSLFRPTRAVYPPQPGQPDPDDLIRDIPFPEKAFSDFQSVPFAQPPKRDVPSILIAHLSNPQTQSPEPDWLSLMNHFKENRCLDGPGNCQDLYVFTTRIVLPNTIIENRRLLHELYMARPTLSPNIRFRYDACPSHTAFTPLTSEPLDAVQSRPTRPVLRSVPTPAGKDFLQWLGLPMNTPAGKGPCPEQVVHRGCVLDGYLDEDESVVRRARPEALLRRTAKVLSLFWWVEAQNVWLRRYRDGGWGGIERECFA